MPNTVYLDPSAGTPTVIEIDGVCYSLGPQTSAPSDTTSYDDGSGCCPNNPAPCSCPSGLSESYNLTYDIWNYGDPCSPVFVASESGTVSLISACFWDGLDSAGEDIHLFLDLDACSWGVTPTTGYHVGGTKPTGGDPTGTYSPHPPPCGMTGLPDPFYVMMNIVVG